MRRLYETAQETVQAPGYLTRLECACEEFGKFVTSCFDAWKQDATQQQRRSTAGLVLLLYYLVFLEAISRFCVASGVMRISVPFIRRGGVAKKKKRTLNLRE